MDAHMPHPGGFSRAMVVASAIALVFLAGCTASSPRFRTGGGTASKDEENELHWSGKIRDEETREDDRKVSLEDVKRVSTPRPGRQKYSNQTPAGIDRDRVLLDVVSYLGAPYAYGGNNKEGIDCSGFTVRVYESAARKQLPGPHGNSTRSGIRWKKTGSSSAIWSFLIRPDGSLHMSGSISKTICLHMPV
jgi:cell wall-associated NlpC family hydrolase